MTIFVMSAAESSWRSVIPNIFNRESWPAVIPDVFNRESRKDLGQKRGLNPHGEETPESNEYT